MRPQLILTRLRHYFIAMLVPLALSACSGATLLNAIVPKSGYTTYTNINYGNKPRQQLDIYVPEKLNPHPITILFFYGGSWQYGSKDQYRFVGQAFASQGFITVIADYRLYPSVYFPTFLDDCAEALVWVHKHIEEYGGNPGNIFLAGHSAGAFNAVMLTINHSYVKHAGGKPAWIKGTIGIAGPYDFLPFTDPEVKAVFSKVKDDYTQPINLVSSGLPPMLLVTGSGDTKVYPKNAINLYNKLRQYNDPAKLIVYPHLGHIGIVVSLAYGFRSTSSLLDDITVFVEKNSVTNTKNKTRS